MAEALVDRGVKVTLVEKNPHVLPPLDAEIAALVEGELKAHGVEVVAGTGLASLEAAGGRATGVKVEDGRVFPADLVILSIGVRPNVELAREAGLEIGPSGGIAVDGMQRTSDPAILAVGDATEVVHGASGRRVRVPLGGPANRQGRVAGTVAGKGEAPDAGRVMGTAIVQAFGVGAGITGLSEKAAKEAGLRFDTAYVTPAHHASYYPGATPLRVKLVYEVPSGRVLGAQAAGRNGVDKRLDVVATVLHFGGTVHDLAKLDLAYAPQFGSAKDPVHMAAFVAQNQLAGVVRGVTWAEAQSEGVGAKDGGSVGMGVVLVDVRTPGEFAKGALPGAVNVPLEVLRGRAGELPKDRPVVTYCQVGQRGYVAARVLGQMGFADVRNLKGGYVVAAGVAV
jgi:rhodanese-related sulfurtransferase